MWKVSCLRRFRFRMKGGVHCVRRKDGGRQGGRTSKGRLVKVSVLCFQFHSCIHQQLPVQTLFGWNQVIHLLEETNASDWLWRVPSPTTCVCASGQVGGPCLRSSDCSDSLCCARHFWTRICKPVLRQGQVCSRRRLKRNHGLELFQRCPCGDGLGCRTPLEPGARPTSPSLSSSSSLLAAAKSKFVLSSSSLHSSPHTSLLSAYSSSGRSSSSVAKTRLHVCQKNWGRAEEEEERTEEEASQCQLASCPGRIQTCETLCAPHVIWFLPGCLDRNQFEIWFDLIYTDWKLFDPGSWSENICLL